MAFLQRIINGGGQILREPAVGSGRLDLCVVYQGKKYPIELKIRYSTTTQAEGLEQVANYMDTLGEKNAWLCIFDRRKIAWTRKIYQKTETMNGKTVFVFGL
jgi:hypothetical protein